jgi:hypothetical protein
LYLKPAAKRAEQMRKDMQPTTPGTTPTMTSMDYPRPAGLPDKQTAVDIMVNDLGMSREQAEADYDATVKKMRGV